MTPQKSVLQLLSFHEKRIKKKALETVSGFPGVTSIEIDDKTGKLTVVGEVDIPKIVMKLRKICKTDIVTVDVVKPPEKKSDPPKSEKPPEILQYYCYPPYAYYCYPPYCLCVDDPNTCVIM